MQFHPWNPRKPERPRPGMLPEVQSLAADARVHRIFDWFARNERRIAEFQMSITGVPAPPFAEQVRAAWLGEQLSPLGLELSGDAAGNLLALRKGQQADAPVIALSAHLDTVFPAATPIAVRRQDSRLFGPGISDNGAGLAALWALAAAFAECGVVTASPLLFVGNTGEEGEGNLRGMRHLYRTQLGSALPDLLPAPKIAALVAIDGAGVDNIIALALGSRRFEVVIEGPGGHSWSDYGTPNPIVAAAAAIHELARLVLPEHPRTTVNVGTIAGGTSVNAIPERVTFRVDVRSSDARRLKEVEQHLRRMVADACTEAAGSSPLRLAHQVLLVGERPAGELAEDSRLLTALRAVDAQLGIGSELMRASTDANIPLSLNLEAVTLGGGGRGGGAHTLHEWFDCAGREQALRRLALLTLLLAGFPAADDSPPDSSRPDFSQKDPL
ncbi:MAG: M20/M25/M40 family metallo-hydrolase [Acidobacteriota bacterium]|nr:M20/M25/M40 family metallo-hydrolase [Acidobacteriota bacterium]